MNKVILIGRVGNDAETKQFDGGRACVRFSLATSESWKDQQGNRQEDVQWHNCTGWGERFAKLAQWITKGRQLCVTGKVKYRESQVDGVMRKFTDIEVQDIEFLSSQSEGQKEMKSPAPAFIPAKSQPMTEGGLGDLPF